MTAAGTYILRVAGAAIISGAVLTLLQSTAYDKITRLICGLFIMVVVMNPMIDFRFPDFSMWSDMYIQEGIAAASYGENLSREELSKRIKEACEAYILDKAAAINVSVQPSVIVTHDEIPVPVYVRLSGTPSQKEQKILEKIISEDLGIPKESQQWIP